ASASQPSVSRLRPVFLSNGLHSSGCWRIRSSRPSLLSSDLKDPIDSGEGSSVKCATPRAQLVAPNLFQTERNCAELAIPKIACSLRCHELSESARPRADLPHSPDCMSILQTVWRSEGDSNPRCRGMFYLPK